MASDSNGEKTAIIRFDADVDWGRVLVASERGAESTGSRALSRGLRLNPEPRFRPSGRQSQLGGKRRVCEGNANPARKPDMVRQRNRGATATGGRCMRFDIRGSSLRGRVGSPSIIALTSSKR
jgi:hypothetical protein